MVPLSFEVGVLDLDELEDYVAGGSLHSFVSHVSIAEIRIARGPWGYFEGELFDSRDDFLRVAEVTLSANDLPFSLASRADLSIEVIVASSQFNSTGDSTLSSALLASHDVVRVLSTCAFAVRASYLLLN